MKCPVDNTELEIKKRAGIDISYCPSCNGVWLGKTELDKVIEHSEKNKTEKEKKPEYPEMKNPKEIRDQKPDQEWVQSSLKKLFDF